VNLFFAELPGFTKDCLQMASDEELRRFQNELAASPTGERADQPV
jgi:hypothetical protein